MKTEVDLLMLRLKCRESMFVKYSSLLSRAFLVPLLALLRTMFSTSSDVPVLLSDSARLCDCISLGLHSKVAKVSSQEHMG